MKWLKLEPALVGSTVAAVYAAAAMAYRAYVAHDGVLDVDLLVAAGSACWLLWTRSRVTPLALPRDDQGRALRASQQ